MKRIKSGIIPGVALAAAAAGIAVAVQMAVPTVSPLLVAILLGVAVANIGTVPPLFMPGIQFSAKKLLRAGIILLGLKLSLGEIWELGPGVLTVVITVVTVGIIGTILLGRGMGVSRKLTLLIASGFSICGAAAVAGVEQTVDADEEDVVTAIALVVIFGTLMIPLVPVVVALMHVEPVPAGLWAGASVHEVAQVVAVGEIIGGGALQVAVVTKLARVLLLAPVVLILSVTLRKQKVGDPAGHAASTPPLVPPFILGFLALVAVRSAVPIPPAILDVAAFAQTWLLSMAMFALGCGVHVRELKKVGVRPFVLAALATLLVAATAAAGVTLTQAFA